MIPVYIIGLLVQFVPLIRLRLNRNIMQHIDDFSNYSMYSIVADISRVLLVGLFNSSQSIAQGYIANEMSRAQRAINLEVFRLPLQRLGLRKKSNKDSTEGHVAELTKFPQNVQDLINSLLSVVITGTMLYSQLGYYVLTAITFPYLFSGLRWGLEYTAGREDKWESDERWFNHFKDLDTIIEGIKSIKIFAWEQMFLNRNPKPASNRNSRLPWYAPVMRLIWRLFVLANSFLSELTTLMAVYAFLNSQAMTGTNIANTRIVEIDLLLRTLQSGLFALRNNFSNVKSALKSNHKFETLLKDGYLNSLSNSDDTSKVGPLVEMDHCSFTWGTGDKVKDVLSDVSLSASAGDLVAIVGKTGAGKSSLLLAMCSEVEMTQGTGRLVGKIAYLEQQPWIMNDTLRANVLFGREYDEDYYWKVLSTCALIDDLEMWPNSDLTVIGENGMNISGGQRARLALARTVYSKADIYFLDDPLSAVDAIVKRHILDNIILSTGLLGDKLRFVTSNADSISTLCNQIATVDNGHVSVKVQTPLVHTAFEYKPKAKPKQKDVETTSKDLQTVSASDKKQTANTFNETTGMVISAGISDNHSSDENSHYPKQWSHWDNSLYALRICGLP
ncbi:hypothetical protein GGF41_001269, partial [Coemansia sp. RSA 2531]